MALNATIFKFTISLSDLNRDYYDTLQLTVARHPSESDERMMARVLAFCLCARESLEFTKGLSTPDSPDAWARELTGEIALWIEVGEPAADKLKKASRIARDVRVFSFNTKSETWWAREQSKIQQLSVSVIRFPWEAIQELTQMVQRGMVMSVTISENSAFVAMDNQQCEVHWEPLQF